MCVDICMHIRIILHEAGTEQGSLQVTQIKSLCMIHILKLSTDLFSRNILEVLRKINTIPIVCNAQRLLEGVHKICSAGVSGALCKYCLLLLRKIVEETQVQKLMHQFCVWARTPPVFKSSQLGIHTDMGKK